MTNVTKYGTVIINVKQYCILLGVGEATEKSVAFFIEIYEVFDYTIKD